MKGRRRGRGWQYGGGDSRAYTRRMTQRLIDYFGRQNYPELRTAAETFLRTCGREGHISAINTWDGQILTWGVGFAYGKINRRLWREISGETRRELIRRAPHRCGSRGIQVDASIRTDTRLLEALIYVAENDPFRESVFRAMFKCFMEGTLGIDIDHPARGRHYTLEDSSLVYFASRLAHWLPAGYRMDRDLPVTQRLAAMSDSASVSTNATQFVAASIHVFADRFTRSSRFASTRAGNRRVLRETIGDRFNMIAKWQNRMRQFVRQDTAFTITPTVRRLVPAFQHAASPFFEIHRDWRDIPEGRLILSERRNGRDLYIDAGPR